MPVMMDDKARAAAVEAASFENRLSKVEADLNALKWMVGVNIALNLASLSGTVGLLIKIAAPAAGTQ